jgi:hypothetical protein
LFAAERARIFFGGYRRSDAHDAEVYVASIAAVLALFDEDVIKEVTDPRTGICTHDKFAAFPPNAGELKRYCDAHAAHRERMRRYFEMPELDRTKQLPAHPAERQPGHFANLTVPKDHPRFPEMVERSKRADPVEWHLDATAIRVPLSWWHS